MGKIIHCNPFPYSIRKKKKKKNHIIEPNITEALVALRLAHLCHVRFNRVILKGDALQVMQALMKDELVSLWTSY
jgi:hypothetical protein